MKVWELHTSLARSIGDPIIKDDGNLYGASDAIANSLLYDGVRYTKDIRDSYLTKAMLSVQLDVIRQCISLPRSHASKILQRLFSQMGQTYTLSINVNGQPTDQLFVYSAILYTKEGFPHNEGAKIWADPVKHPSTVIDTQWNIRNLPILNESDMSAYIGSNTNITPDLIAFVTTRAGYEYIGLAGGEIDFLKAISDEAAIATDVVRLQISYLKRSPDVSRMSPNDNIQFEENFLPHVLNKAIMYAHLDSGELGAAYQAIPFIDQISIGVPQQDANA